MKRNGVPPRKGTHLEAFVDGFRALPQLRSDLLSGVANQGVLPLLLGLPNPSIVLSLELTQVLASVRDIIAVGVSRVRGNGRSAGDRRAIRGRRAMPRSIDVPVLPVLLLKLALPLGPEHRQVVLSLAFSRRNQPALDRRGLLDGRVEFHR